MNDDTAASDVTFHAHVSLLATAGAEPEHAKDRGLFPKRRS
jgi:hypothetical protein